MAAAAPLPVAAKSFEELWRDLLAVPEGSVGEIVAGNIVTHPRPNDPHVGAQTDLGTILGGPFRFGLGGPGGWIFRDEPRVRFGDELRVPDLAAWRAERFVAQPRGPLTVVPDWICEVLSPSTAATDRAEKMPLYAAHGVGHVWLIDPVAQVLEVYRLERGAWHVVGVHAGDAKVRAEPFDAIELDLVDVWGPKREPPRDDDE
jgi:Uma2 family endonuclease